MLSGIIGDDLTMKDDDYAAKSENGSPKPRRGGSDEDSRVRSERSDPNAPCYNYMHYDPELHWCRVCDVFPRSAKDYLNHMHSTEHGQVSQEHQLVDTPWHKLPPDEELPSFKGAPVKRVPIKGNFKYLLSVSCRSLFSSACEEYCGK